jgi:OOP family OmpA-OmpF porin
MSRLQIIVVGTGSLFLLIVACAAFSVPRIEADLESQVVAAKDKANLFWANVEVDGQTVVLTGTAPDYLSRGRAGDLARIIWGVTEVDNRIRLLGESGTCQQEFDTFLAKEQVEFAEGSAVIDPSSYNLLAMLAAIARNCGANIQVIGHTDSQGDRSANLALSRQRALAVKTYLVRSGAEEERIEALGQGEAQPIADDSTDAGRARNRRIEFRVVGMQS